MKQFLPNDPASQAYVNSFALRQTIWVHALGESLRQIPFSPQVGEYLSKNKINGANVPNAILDKHAEELQQISANFQLDANKQVQIDETLSRLTDSMGKCERIKRTVFPRSYSILIHFIIYTFLTIFPFGLNEVGDMPEILLSIFIPSLFIMIEKTAIIMQDPFENRPTDTPVTAIAKTIEQNMNDMSGLHTNIEPTVVNGRYYTM